MTPFDRYVTDATPAFTGFIWSASFAYKSYEPVTDGSFNKKLCIHIRYVF